MTTRVFSAALVALLVAGSLALRAQSLADVARKTEEDRRQQAKQPAKVYTNKDLAAVPPPSATAASTPAAPAATTPSAATDPAKDDKDKEPKKDQAYWSGRLKELQTTLDRDKTYSDALQSRINALTRDFVNEADPARRSVIERDRQTSVRELDRLKKQVVDDQKAIDDLQEEARKAGVPPGWLRS